MKDPVYCSQKTLFHDTRRIQFLLAELHVSLEAVKNDKARFLMSLLLVLKLTFKIFILLQIGLRMKLFNSRFYS